MQTVVLENRPKADSVSQDNQQEVEGNEEGEHGH